MKLLSSSLWAGPLHPLLQIMPPMSPLQIHLFITASTNLQHTAENSVLRLLKAYQQALMLILLSHLQPTKQLIRVHVTAGVSGTVRLTAALPLLRRPARAAVEMHAGSPFQLGMLIK